MLVYYMMVLTNLVSWPGVHGVVASDSKTRFLKILWKMFQNDTSCIVAIFMMVLTNGDFFDFFNCENNKKN